jgi:hypothetical protein
MTPAAEKSRDGLEQLNEATSGGPVAQTMVRRRAGPGGAALSRGPPAGGAAGARLREVTMPEDSEHIF